MTAADLVTVDAVSLAPALLPALGAVLVLVGDAVLPGRRSWQPLLGVVVLAIAAGTALAIGLRAADDPVRTLCLPAPARRLPVDGGPTTGTLQAGILLATAAALALLHDGARGPRDTTVTTTLLLAAATGGVGVAASRDLGTWLVTLELATVPVVALVALRGTRTASHGALTLLVTSVTSFALLVLGAALWLTATGDASFAARHRGHRVGRPRAPGGAAARRDRAAVRARLQALAGALPRVDPAGLLHRRPRHRRRARRPRRRSRPWRPCSSSARPSPAPPSTPGR